MELMSGSGEEKLLHSPSFVAVSCANRDEPILPLYDLITNYPFLTSFPLISSSPQMKKDEEYITADSTSYKQPSS